MEALIKGTTSLKVEGCMYVKTFLPPPTTEFGSHCSKRYLRTSEREIVLFKPNSFNDIEGITHKSSVGSRAIIPNMFS
jgi:hypothetical protein